MLRNGFSIFSVVIHVANIRFRQAYLTDYLHHWLYVVSNHTLFTLFQRVKLPRYLGPSQCFLDYWSERAKLLNHLCGCRQVVPDQDVFHDMPRSVSDFKLDLYLLRPRHSHEFLVALDNSYRESVSEGYQNQQYNTDYYEHSIPNRKFISYLLFLARKDCRN